MKISFLYIFSPILFGATSGKENDTFTFNLSVKVVKVQCD